MKKLLTAAGLMVAMSLAIPAFSYADAQHGCFEHGHHGMQHMAQQLNLSDKQQEQFKQLHRESRDRMQSTRDAMQDNREALMKLDPSAKDYTAQVDKLAAKEGKLVEQMVKEHAKLRADIYAILTPEQRSKMTELHKQREDQCAGKRGGGMGRGPGGGMHDGGMRGMGM
jgi:periplasmic protein CpxP/Spy